MALLDVRWGRRCSAALMLLILALAAASAKTSVNAVPGGDYRLPGDVVPLNYTLKVVPYLEVGNMHYTGTVSITVTCKTSTNVITLHAHEDLVVTVHYVRDLETQLPLPLIGLERDKDKQFFKIKLQEYLQADMKYVVAMSFSNKLQKDNHGFYLSSYAVPGGYEYMATTHFEATSARKAFPCFDEPTYRATFEISLAKLDDQIALSNMPPASEPSDYDPSIGNRRWVTFQQTPPMPSYLVAFVVSKLKRVNTTDENINIYVRGGTEAGVTKAAEVAPKLLKALENLLGLKYPLPKLDLVSIPDFPAGAMENWGLITFKEDQLLVTEGVSTADREAMSLRVIAHEFAHLWFGDWVTLQWWNTIWQQEGMAAFMESYILDLATSAEYEAMSRLGTNRVQAALDADSLEHSVPLTKNDIETPEQIEDHFGVISYSKGSNFHYMLLNILGTPVYRQGLINYLTTNKFQSTTPEDFAEALQAAADEGEWPLKDNITIQDVIDSWANKPGYPVLQILRDYHKNEATVSQSRFLAHTPSDPSALDSRWIIPYSINSVYGKPDAFTEVLLETEQTKTIKLSRYLSAGGYLWANREQSGFYRVNYDMHNWMLLTTASSRLDAASRASLIDDLFALNRAGLVDTWIVLLHLQSTLGARSLSGERDMAPWLTAAKAIRGYAALSRGDPELSTYLQTYLAAILTPAFQAIGWESEYDTDSNRFRKSVVRDTLTQLACDAGMAECRRKALKEYLTYTQEEGKAVYDPNVLTATLCEGVKHSDALELGDILNRAINTEDVTARASYIRAAGCTTNGTLVTMLLDVATQEDSGLSSSEVLALLKSIMDHSPDGCGTVLNYVTDNYPEILNNLGQSGGESILLEIAKRIYNSTQQSQIIDLMLAHPSDKMSDIALVAERTRAWAEDNARELKQWVSASIGVSPPTPPLLVSPSDMPTPVPPTAEPRPTEPPHVTNDWLLPDDLEPDNYVLHIATQMSGTDPDAFTFSGTVAITFKVIRATTQIVMHKHESLNITRTDVVDSGNTPVQLSGDPVFDATKQFYNITLGSSLARNGMYTVRLEFAGPLKKDLAGLYLSSYMEGSEVKYLAVTQFEQTSARKAFPCWDEPKYRAKFDISITHDSSMGALSNMKIKGTSRLLGAATTRTEFEQSPAMPTYLVALLVSELKEVQVTPSDPAISIWVRPGAQDDVALAAELAPKVLKKLEDLTGIKYVLPKLDLAAIPDFAPGAMENWGLITFKDTVLRTPKNALAHRRFNCARDITHEFSHLWFGDLVTNNWWSSLWQQEGMAAFMEAWVLDQATQYEYDAVARQSVDRIEQGLMDDALETAGPITNHTVGSPDEINEHAGELTYNKGAGFLRMIRAILGEHTMWKGLRKYLIRNAYSTAGPDDLAAAFQEAADEDSIELPVTIKAIMDSWTLKKGYPVLQVDRYLHDSYLHLKQYRFLSYEPANATAAEEQWILPYNCEQLYSKGSKPLNRFLLEEEEELGMTVKVVNSVTYVICNTEQEGFFRVNYDLTTWKYLGQALKKGMIASEIQRGAILDDALTMLMARKVEPWVVLNLLENGVPGELSLPAWGALNKGLNHLRAVLANDTKALEDLDAFVRGLTADTFGAVDWYNYWGWTESVQTNEVRQIVSRLACDAEEDLCTVYAAVDNAKSAASADYVVHQETYGAMLCTAFRYETAYDSLMDKLKQTTDYDMRLSIAYALGCAENQDVRLSLLLDLQNGDESIFKSNEIVPFVESLITHGGEFEAVLMICGLWDELVLSLGHSKAVEILQLTAERVNTEEQYGLVQDLSGYDTSIYTAVAERSAAHSLKFVQNELLQVKEYLALANGKKLPTPPALQPTDYRLPGNVVPENYELRMVPYLEEGKFTGSVVITAKVLANTTDIVMHKHEHLNVILLAVVDTVTNQSLAIAGTSFDALPEMYTISMADVVVAGTEIAISIDFAGDLQKDKLGFYLSTYADGVKWKYIATTQFEQTYARKAFPCFDEPKYRATFDISIARMTGQTALCNTPVKSTSQPDPNYGGRVWDTFRTTPKMPTYLVAFIVSELEKVPTSNPNINLYVRPEVVPQAAFAAQITPKILDELQKFTGVPYAMLKLDLVGIPDFYFGAMENWGLCTFRENRMLYKEGSATSEYKIFVAEIIAHELAHLWFGDFVTLDWWSSGWLKEGMAELLQYYILEKVMADDSDIWYPLSRLGVDDVYDGMRQDALEHTRPLTDDDVETQDQIAEHMGTYTYTKGAGLHYMLMGALGVDTFRKGLNNYLWLHQYGSATPEDYADALQAAADEDNALPDDIFVIDLIHSWSAKPGLPVVTLVRNYVDNTVQASQSRYLSQAPEEVSSRDSQWIVPISIYFSAGSEPEKARSYLLDDGNSITINLGGGALGGLIYGNWHEQGYFHTNYDFLNWIRIGSALADPDRTPDPMFRAATINDAFALGRAGLVDPWMPLFLLDQDIPREANAAPYIAAYNGLMSYAALVKSDPATDRLFQMYLHDFLAEIAYGYVGWDSFRGNTDGRVARDYVTKLACYARLAECRTQALQTYRSRSNETDPNVLAAAMCEGMSHASTLEYTAMIEALMAETERSRRMSMVYALGCIHNTTIINGLLELAGTMNGFEPQEVMPMFRSILDNSPAGVDAVLAYVVNNFDNMAAGLGQSSAEKVVLTVAERVTTFSQYSKLSNLDSMSYSPNIRDAVGVATANLEWATSSLPILKDWLAAKVGEKPAPPAESRHPDPQPTPTPAGTPTPGPGPTEPPVLPDNPGSKWRLPSAVAPLHYTLEMVPFLETRHFVFEGREEILLLAEESTNVITLHAKDLDIPEEAIEVRDAATGDQIEIVAISTDDEKSFLNLTLTQNLTAGGMYNLSMEFSADLRTDNFGFYVSSYVVNDEIKYMATTHFEATSARKAFPCFDEPRFRATFDISVARLPSQTALSNMPLIGTSGPDMAIGGRVWDDFATTPSMPTYLVAFMVHELSKRSTTNPNVNIWVRPNAVSDAQVAAEIAPKAIKAMEDYTNFKMPVPKVDLVAIPTFPIGAMENWGLATFREDYLINPKKAKSEHAFTCSNVITHELSHFWFGDLVTIDWWSAAWLKEGMASFLELYMLDKADNAKYSAYQRIIYEHVQPAMVADARETAGVLTNYTVGSPEEISDHMDIITYSKGGSFLRMMMNYVGESAYRRGLEDYISSNAYYWGTPEKLASALQNAVDTMNISTKVSVQDMFDSWTLKPGYPVVTLVRDREQGIATLTQKRFLTHDPTPDYDSIATWNVPYNLWIEGTPIPTGYSDVLVEEQTEKVILMDDSDYKLVLINAEETGFYRVRYDLLTYIYINLRLERLKIPSALQRAVLLDDAFALTMTRELEWWVPLAMMNSGLPYEKDLMPWMAARNALFRLRAILGADDESLGYLDMWTAQLVKPVFESVDWDSRWPGVEEYDQKLLRDVASQVACTAGSELCKRSADFDFTAWYFQTDAPNPDTLAAALCQGLGGVELERLQDFVVVWSRFLSEDDPTVRSSILYGLGCMSNDYTENLLKAATTHNGIKSNEAKIYFNSFVAHNPDGVNTLISYVRSHFDEIRESIGVQSLASILQLLAERISTETQLKAIQRMAGMRCARSIDMTVVNQTASLQYKWAQENLASVQAYLAAAAGVVPPLPPTPGPPTEPTLPPEPSPSGAFRLPSTVVPHDYKLTVVPYLSGEKQGTFDGKVVITFEVTDVLLPATFNLHSVGLNFGIDDIVITDQDQHEVQVLSVFNSELMEWKMIYLYNSPIPGSTYTMTITYNGTLSDDLQGFYLTSQDGNQGPLTIAMTKLAPTYARRVFPCFDEPALRATFTLTVGVLPTETAISNTPIDSTSQPDPSIGNRTLVTFKKTPKISTHGLTIVVSPGIHWISSADKKVMVYGTDRVVATAQDTIDAAKSIIQTLEDTTGTASGLDTLALVAVKDLLVEGTDNWAVDILRENALVKLDDTASAGEADIYWLTSMAHRIAQHWFGNLVSMSWWDNVWLTDAFGTYFQYKAAVQTDADGALMLYPATFSARVVSPALVADSLESAPALNNQHVIGSTAGIEKSIGDISALKGGAIVSSLPHILGSTAFEKGLKTLLANNYLSGVEPSALYDALQSGVDSDSALPFGADLATVLSSWVDQPGYPVVNVVRNYDEDSVTLTQERFLAHTPSGGADTNSTWWIPVSYSTRAQYNDQYAKTPVRAWMEPFWLYLDLPLPSKSAAQWLLVNLDRKGFYRVNYDMQNWLMLALYMSEPGNHAVIEVPTRVMLLDDVLALARTGRLDYVTALQYADYLRTEYVTHEVFAQARESFGAHIETFVLGTELEAVYKAWVANLLAGAIKYFDYIPKPDDNSRYRVARSVVMEWACDLDIPDCIEPAKADFNDWLEAINSVPHDTVGSTVCAGVRYIDYVTTFERAVTNLALEMNDVYRKAIIRGLGCVSDVFMAKSVLKLTAEQNALRGGEALEVFKSVSRFGPSSVNTTLDFLMDQVIEVYKASGMETTKSIISLIASRVTTDEHNHKLNAVIKTLMNGSASRELAVAQILASDNLQWHGTHLHEVGDMLYALSGVPNPDLPTPPTTPAPLTTMTIPSGPTPTDPATATPAGSTATWFTLPPTGSPTSPGTLPPLTSTTHQPRTSSAAPTKAPAPTPAGAAGMSVSLLVIVLSVAVLVLGRGAGAGLH